MAKIILYAVFVTDLDTFFLNLKLVKYINSKFTCAWCLKKYPIILEKTCVHTCSYEGKLVYGQEACPLEYGIAIGLHLDNLIQFCNSVRNLAFGNRHGISRRRGHPSDFVPIQSRQPHPWPCCNLQQTMKKRLF